MDVSHLLSEIDAKIASLQTARAAILSINADAPAKGKRGRPKGSKNGTKPASSKRKLTPEGRKRIADAMKRRWANARKAKDAPKKEVVKKEVSKKEVAKK